MKLKKPRKKKGLTPKGYCMRCMKRPRVKHHRMCPQCLNKSRWIYHEKCKNLWWNRTWKRFNDRAKRQGLCPRCKKRKPQEKHRMCLECLREQRHVFEMRRDAGVCWMCGAPKPEIFTRCKTCRDRTNQNKKKWWAKNKQYEYQQKKDMRDLQNRGIGSDRRKGDGPRDWFR